MIGNNFREFLKNSVWVKLGSIIDAGLHIRSFIYGN